MCPLLLEVRNFSCLLSVSLRLKAHTQISHTILCRRQTPRTLWNLFHPIAMIGPRIRGVEYSRTAGIPSSTYMAERATSWGEPLGTARCTSPCGALAALVLSLTVSLGQFRVTFLLPRPDSPIASAQRRPADWPARKSFTPKSCPAPLTLVRALSEKCLRRP